jgi:hypothetical protein
VIHETSGLDKLTLLVFWWAVRESNPEPTD